MSKLLNSIQRSFGIQFESDVLVSGKVICSRNISVAKRFSRTSSESCYDIYKRKRTAYDGVYTIYPHGNASLAVDVYCDMTNGGYTVGTLYYVL